ncbi:MAG: Gx transporter family protein [Gammaproteobacteria bacterium]|nr:Gx transporter family protein [Gammaproteobacteria bacterium]
MTETHIRYKVSSEDYRIARLAALAICIHVLESALPSPIPGIKPGLANVISIAVFFIYGWRAAVWVSLLRVVVGSLIIGSFLTPTFMLSLAGSLATLLILFAVLPLKKLGLGPVGAAVLAAMGHITGQFLLAYFLIIPNPGLFYLFPPLLTAALIFGLVTGLIAQNLLDRLESKQEHEY